MKQLCRNTAASDEENRNLAAKFAIQNAIQRRYHSLFDTDANKVTLPRRAWQLQFA